MENEDVGKVIETFGRMMEREIRRDESVRGTVTLRLVTVTLERGFDVFLESQGLEAVPEGTALRVRRKVATGL